MTTKLAVNAHPARARMGIIELPFLNMTPIAMIKMTMPIPDGDMLVTKPDGIDWKQFV